MELKTKSLFKDDHKLQGALGLSQEEADGLDIKVQFTIEETTEIELADLDQELFDKLFLFNRSYHNRTEEDRFKIFHGKRLSGS